MAASAWTSAPARALDFLSDERLARLAARGDQRAFGALFERHHAGLTRYCQTVLRHTADAEDAAQNAMVAALRALEGGTVPLRVKPWLYKIAHNEAITLVRSRRPAEELDEATLPAVADAEEAGEVRRRLGQLMADLQALTERQREALVLRELCGMGYPEIALALGSSEAAAQQTVFEARSALTQFGEGRDLACEGVQRAMSECDGMRLRTRKVRAHVRGCAGCASFEAALLARRRDLGLLFPQTGAAGGVLAALSRLLGGGGEPLLAGLGLKGAAVGLAVLAGGGAIVATSVANRAPAPRAVTSAPVVALPAPQNAATASSATQRSGADSSRLGAERRRQDARDRPARGERPSTSSGDPAPEPAADAREPESSSRPAAADASTGARPGDTVVSPGAPPRLPRLTAPVDQTATAVGATITSVTQAAQDTLGDAAATADGAVDAVTDTLQGTIDTVDALPELP